MAEASKPWELVGNPSYFRQVLGNMVALGFGPRFTGEAYVRFGNTGIGHAPHYQIEDEDGSKHCFSGLNHKSSSEGAFESDHLSEERFTYADIQAMLESLIGTHRQ